METLEEVMKMWKQEGFSIDFNRDPGRKELASNPSDFQIDKVYRYEGMTNPDDEEILYAISSIKSGKKGLLINAYGIYAEDAIDKLVEKLKYHQ